MKLAETAVSVAAKKTGLRPDQVQQAVAEYRATSAALHDEPDWQPIETAPKDGTRIITWQPDTKAAYGEAIQHWDDDVREDQRGRCDGGWSDDEGYWTARPPTHWRPLPSPPGEAASSQNAVKPAR